jgi:hypothetical protein
MKKSDVPAHSDALGDLDLPDWSGMEDSSARVTAETAFQLSEQYRAAFVDTATNGERPAKITVEFTL